MTFKRHTQPHMCSLTIQALFCLMEMPVNSFFIAGIYDLIYEQGYRSLSETSLERIGRYLWLLSLMERFE